MCVGRKGCTTPHIYLICVSLSVLLGCPCCSTVDETLENVARGLASRIKKEKSHWAAGRVGDIDFSGSTKTRGKVKLDNKYTRLYNSIQRDIIIHFLSRTLTSICLLTSSS